MSFTTVSYTHLDVYKRQVDALPVELHLPGYRFCGPGTKLKERLARGERGINELDEACREHDIAYARYKDNSRRRIADRVLADKAWERVKDWNSGVSERAYAAAVAAAMKTKSAVGGGSSRSGCRKKKKGSGIKRQSAGKRKKTCKRNNTKRKTVSRHKRNNKKIASGLYLRPYRPVSYTHLDVYKRQRRCRP